MASAKRLPGVDVAWCHTFVPGGYAEPGAGGVPKGGGAGAAGIGWVGGLPPVGWLDGCWGGVLGGCTGGCSDMAFPFTPPKHPAPARKMSGKSLGIAYEPLTASPRISTASARISTLRILPVTVMGNPSTTWTYRGTL